MRKLTTAQKRKLTQELTCIAVAILGIVLFVLNFFKIVPDDFFAIQFIIAYGFIIGPIFAVLGIAAFFETKNIPVKKFRKKAR